MNDYVIRKLPGYKQFQEVVMKSVKSPAGQYSSCYVDRSMLIERAQCYIRAKQIICIRDLSYGKTISTRLFIQS